MNSEQLGELFNYTQHKQEPRFDGIQYGGAVDDVPSGLRLSIDPSHPI
jgi:hypothetical protein